MCHFWCHQNSSFLQCEFKSFYILPNTAHSGLNSPSTLSQTISGFISWNICVLFVIFRVKSVTQIWDCNRFITLAPVATRIRKARNSAGWLHAGFEGFYLPMLQSRKDYFSQSFLLLERLLTVPWNLKRGRSERHEGSSNKKCAANLVTIWPSRSYQLFCNFIKLCGHFILNVYAVHFAETIVKINIYYLFDLF